MLKRVQALFLAFGLLSSLPTLACSAFEFGSNGQGGLAHNFDWYTGMGFTAAWFVNARNVTKSGLNLYDSDPVAHWTSKYGSVTYSLVGSGFPVGGQNEKGLVIHIQQNASAQYPTGSLPVVDGLQWPQYLLDTSATVSEALANAALVRPNSSLALHYFLCDATGACAVVDFLNGEMLTYSGQGLPVSAMTNTDYPTSLQDWQSCQSAEKSCTNSDNSVQRFITSAQYSTQYAGQDSLAYALEGLNSVAQTTNPITRYHFFNPMAATGLMYFMAYTQTQWQTFDMSKIDFSCASEGNYFEIDPTATGDQTSMFQPYSQAEQNKLVSQLPAQPAWVPLIENYPTTTSCND